MYQAIYYDFQTYTYHLRDDKQGWMDFQFQPTYWKRVNEWQDGAKPVLTGGWAKATKKYNKEDTNLLEKDIDKSLIVLRELYYKLDDVVPSWHNIIYLDIEIEMGGALTPEYIKSAPMPITSIALIDVSTKQKICFVTDKSKKIQETTEKDKYIKSVIPCGSEKELIKRFLDKWEELDPTIVVGYNSAYFDMPYKNLSEASFKRNEAGNKEANDELRDWKIRTMQKNLVQPKTDLFVGKYKNEVYGDMEIKKEGNQLVLNFANHPMAKGKLEYMGNDEFMCTYSYKTWGITKMKVKYEDAQVKSVIVKVNDFVDYMDYDFKKQ